MSGWVKIHRKITESDLWGWEPFTRGQAWIDLILMANHKDGTIIIRGQCVTVKRGQVGCSEVKMAEKWSWSRGKVRRFLKLLKTRQQIEQQKNNVTSLICIVNYDEYQGDSTANRTADGTANGQQTDSRRYPNKNVKNVKNEKNNKQPPKAPLQKRLKTHLDKSIANGLVKYSGKLFEFYEYRMSLSPKRRYKTTKGIDGLLRDVKNCEAAGLDPTLCMDRAMEKEWLTPDPRYFKDEIKNKPKSSRLSDAGLETARRLKKLEREGKFK